MKEFTVSNKHYRIALIPGDGIGKEVIPAAVQVMHWDEVLAEVARDYPDIQVANYHVDALAARMITHPKSLDVVVASNLFADILTDLGAALQGSLGLAASANLNPAQRLGPPMFEPVHGSAPDIAGHGIANPIAATWTAALMMEHLGEREASKRLLAALKKVTGERRVCTPDLGGSATTQEFAAAVVGRVEKSPSKQGSR
jgi:tartrate dehydrogenase/decarboxylase/D-malate dehydrogenase